MSKTIEQLKATEKKIKLQIKNKEKKELETLIKLIFKGVNTENINAYFSTEEGKDFVKKINEKIKEKIQK